MFRNFYSLKLKGVDGINKQTAPRVETRGCLDTYIANYKLQSTISYQNKQTCWKRLQINEIDIKYENQRSFIKNSFSFRKLFNVKILQRIGFTKKTSRWYSQQPK